jgi:glycosyltransferase involved in cell wall biosynthesis
MNSTSFYTLILGICSPQVRICISPRILIVGNLASRKAIEMKTLHDKSILVVYLTPPASLGKSAQMLTLKYLRPLGWSPTVVTVARPEITGNPVTNWCGVDVITVDPSANPSWRLSQTLYRARSRLAKANILPIANGKVPGLRMLSASLDYALLPATAALSFPDRYRQAAPALLEAARLLHREKDFKAVLSVYHPITAHLVARELAQKEGLPWVVLTKDYYSKQQFQVSSHLDRMTNWVKARYERSVVGKSDALLPVFDEMAEYLRQLMPQANVRLLTHCYDDEDFIQRESIPTKPGQAFRILWLGAVQHFDKEDIEVFLAALIELLKQGNISRQSFRARFVGPSTHVVSSWSKKLGGDQLEGLLEVVPLVPHQEAMEELKQATCLLYTPQVESGGRRRLPEFLASKKPILVFPPEFERTMSDRVLRKYGAAKIVDRDKEQIKAVLSAWYREFNATGRLELPVNEDIVQSFSASHVAAELDAVLQEVTK